MTGLFIQWLYSDAPASFWQYRKQLVTALLSFFSVSTLSRTLFDPWRHDSVDVSRLPVKLRWQAMVNNMISRLIGFMLRLFVIGTGLGSAAGATVGILLFTIAWYLLPLLLLASIGYGIKLVLGF